MKPFIKHTGLVAPMDRVNVDTDQMVPKQFLKLQTRRVTGASSFMIGGICREKSRIRSLC